MKVQEFLVKIIVYLIIGYQYAISPNLLKVCRFYPTCSEYSRQALLKYGLFRGIYLSVKRILRCNPFFQGGYDPVDPVRKFESVISDQSPDFSNRVDPQLIGITGRTRIKKERLARVRPVIHIKRNNTAKEMRFSK